MAGSIYYGVAPPPPRRLRHPPVTEPSLCILVPVLGRPERALPLAVSIRETTTLPHRVLYLCSPGDPAAEAYKKIGEVRTVSWDPGPGDFALKTTYGISISSEPWIFFGSTDLEFESGWDRAALNVSYETGKRVIGTNDDANPLVKRGGHFTHPLVHRSYIEEYGVVDEPGAFYSSAYDHQSVDVEAYETARLHGEIAFARYSVVRHLHPIWHTAPMDETYTKALAKGKEDQALFLSRRHLWRTVA